MNPYQTYQDAEHMTARIWTTAILEGVLLLVEDIDPYEIRRTGETVEVYETELEVRVLAALLKGGDTWIVRYDTDTFV